MQFRSSVLLILACALTTLSSQADSLARREGLFPIQGADPSLNESDLRPLDRTIEGARLVAVAESAHGSRNYKKLQQRLVQYLVAKKGFRTLIVENPFLRSQSLHNYVQTCAEGAAVPIDVLDHAMEEDLSLVKWICSFNRAHPKDPVVFRGDDIWDRPWEIQALAEKLNTDLKLGFDGDLRVTREKCWAHNVSDWDAGKVLIGKIGTAGKIPDEDFLPCTAALTALRERTGREIRFARNSKERYSLYTLLQSIQTLEGWQNVWNLIYRDNDGAWTFRDTAQAKNILSILRQENPRGKGILITHISHATKMRSASDWGGMLRQRSTGSFLDQALGDGYRVIELSAYSVTGYAQTFELPTSPDSLELALHQRGEAFTLVESDGAFIRSKEKWWVQNENSETYSNGVFLKPRDNFDALIFADTSPEGTPILPWYDPFFR